MSILCHCLWVKCRSIWCYFNKFQAPAGINQRLPVGGWTQNRTFCTFLSPLIPHYPLPPCLIIWSVVNTFLYFFTTIAHCCSCLDQMEFYHWVKSRVRHHFGWCSVVVIWHFPKAVASLPSPPLLSSHISIQQYHTHEHHHTLNIRFICFQLRENRQLWTYFLSSFLHTRTHALLCRQQQQPAKTPMVHEIFVMHLYSLNEHTHAHTTPVHTQTHTTWSCTHTSICLLKSVQAHTLTHAL